MEPDVLIFPPKRSKLVSQGLVMLVGLGLSIWIMGNATLVMHRELRLTVFFAAFFGCVAFGYGLLYNVLRIKSTEPLLKADREGLWFHGSYTYYGKILWSDIAGYEVVQYGLGKRVIIKLRQPEAFAVKYADFRKFIFRRMLKRYGTPVALPVSLFEADVVDMLHKISAYGAKMH